MQNLPDFGQYSEQTLSNEEIKSKKQQYGIKENSKNDKAGALLGVKQKNKKKGLQNNIFG